MGNLYLAGQIAGAAERKRWKRKVHDFNRKSNMQEESCEYNIVDGSR